MGRFDVALNKKPPVPKESFLNRLKKGVLGQEDAGEPDSPPVTMKIPRERYRPPAVQVRVPPAPPTEFGGYRGATGYTGIQGIPFEQNHVVEAGATGISFEELRWNRQLRPRAPEGMRSNERVPQRPTSRTLGINYPDGTVVNVPIRNMRIEFDETTETVALSFRGARALYQSVLRAQENYRNSVR